MLNPDVLRKELLVLSSELWLIEAETLGLGIMSFEDMKPDELIRNELLEF